MDAEQVNSIGKAGAPQPATPVEKKGSAASAEKAAKPAVANNDTVSLSSEARQALEGAKSVEQGGPQSQQRKFDVTENNQVILKIKDQETQEVVKQIPAEEEVRLRQAIQEGVESLDENV